MTFLSIVERFFSLKNLFLYWGQYFISPSVAQQFGMARTPTFLCLWFYVHYGLCSNFIFTLLSVESSCRRLICSVQKLPSSRSKLPLPVVTAVISEAARLQREGSLVLSLCSQAIFPMLLFYYFILFVVPVILPGQRGKEI